MAGAHGSLHVFEIGVLSYPDEFFSIYLLESCRDLHRFLPRLLGAPDAFLAAFFRPVLANKRGQFRTHFLSRYRRSDGFLCPSSHRF